MATMRRWRWSSSWTVPRMRANPLPARKRNSELDLSVQRKAAFRAAFSFWRVSLLCRGDLDFARSEQLRDLFCGQRPAEQEALNEIAAMILKKRELLGVFNTFGHHVELETMRHCDDRLGDRDILGVARQILDE